MRISDWSSDVCSSDLSTDDAFKAHEVGVITDEALRNATGFTDSDAPEDGGIDEDVAMVLAMVNTSPALAANPGMPELLRQVREVLAGRAAEEPEPTPEPEPEIGRASGRERGGQYVWISVVAGSLKKKNKARDNQCLIYIDCTNPQKN